MRRKKIIDIEGMRKVLRKREREIVEVNDVEIVVNKGEKVDMVGE